jgi:hypothetical protein
VEYEAILTKLLGIPSIWTIENKPSTLASFQTLNEFVNPILKKMNNDSQSDPKKIAYHQSLVHFIMYYAYYPKIPFVIKTNDHLFLCSFHGKNYNKMEISVPFFDKPNLVFDELDILLNKSQLSSLIKKLNVKQILFRDIPDEFINILRSSDTSFSFHLSSLKELNYQIYDLKRTLSKKGKEFSNLRWHLNKFKAANHNIEKVRLHDHITSVIHLIGEWKRTAVNDRGFSYINVKSDKQAARLFAERSDQTNHCLSRVLKIDGRIASFNFGYPIGLNSEQYVFAHAVGIADTSISHLAEYAQYDFWKYIQNTGFSYVNDGPSWTKNLEIYKQKFRPISRKRYYFATMEF